MASPIPAHTISFAPKTTTRKAIIARKAHLTLFEITAASPPLLESYVVRTAEDTHNEILADLPLAVRWINNDLETTRTLHTFDVIRFRRHGSVTPSFRAHSSGPQDFL